jgi:hypothetical protein
MLIECGLTSKAVGTLTTLIDPDILVTKGVPVSVPAQLETLSTHAAWEVIRMRPAEMARTATTGGKIISTHERPLCCV